MSIASQARALLTVLSPADFERMSPAERERFADLCRHVAKQAEPPARRPVSGVLFNLHEGARSE
jgi:hypothetical protein